MSKEEAKNIEGEKKINDRPIGDDLELGLHTSTLKRLSTNTIKEMMELERQNNYNCFNTKLDRRLLEYGLLIIILTYCIYQLVANSSRENSFEVSVLSLIVGIISQNLRNGMRNDKGQQSKN